MTLVGTAAPPAPAGTASATFAPTPKETTPRLLAVVLGRDSALATLDAAYSAARDSGREVHTALLLPRVPFTLDAGLLGRLAEQADREACDLVTLAAQRAAAAGVPARIRVHRVGGRNARHRRRVLDRTVARLARRLDAVPVGWPAP